MTEIKASVSVDHENKCIHIPKLRTISSEKLEVLLVHEVGSHLLRRLSGEKSTLLLLSLGLDRYEAAEEGIATLLEQALLQEELKEFSGGPKDLAISLAEGLDGTPRDFREIFNIMEKYYYFAQLINTNQNTEEVKNSSQDLAWNRAVRTFRGTTCKQKGICFTKDLIYKQGNIKIWDLISRKPGEIKNFFLGKYDPTNPEHITILSNLGIID